jgi:hypothetical protein
MLHIALSKGTQSVVSSSPSSSHINNGGGVSVKGAISPSQQQDLALVAVALAGYSAASETSLGVRT